MKYHRYHEYGRINKILEAIDSGDIGQYWSNPKHWLKEHGYTGQFYVHGVRVYLPVRYR